MAIIGIPYFQTNPYVETMGTPGGLTINIPEKEAPETIPEKGPGSRAARGADVLFWGKPPTIIVNYRAKTC